MTIQTSVNCGDKIFTPFHDGPLTVGQIRVSYTDSKGVNGGDTLGNGRIFFDNYKPQKEYVEEYMCDETGIGSGSIFRLGESAFLTKQQAAINRAERERNLPHWVP